MTTNRRQFTSAGLALAAASFFSGIARSQARKGVILLGFAGGTADAWRRFYAEPFQKQTGIPAKVIEVSDPTPWYIGRGTEFNSSVTSGVDYPLYERGLVEPIKIADFSVLKKIPEIYWTKIDDKLLLGMPVYQGSYGIAINTKFIKPGEITSWFDLTNPKYKGKIAANRFSEVYDIPWFAKISGGSEVNQEVWSRNL